MNPSPLQLERHFFTKVHVDAHRDGDPDVKEELRGEVDVERATKDPRSFQLTLRLKLLPAAAQKSCYTAEIHVVGLVRVVEKWPEPKILQLVQANGPALLYGAAREMLCNLTARGPWPMLCLNSVTFVQPATPTSTSDPTARKTPEGTKPVAASSGDPKRH